MQTNKLLSNYIPTNNQIMIHCTNCQLPYPQDAAPYCCPACGGSFDFDAPAAFDAGKIDSHQPGMWRYRHSFGLPLGASVITLGEGDTPLVWSRTFGREVAFKLEYLNPTGSFKDRGTALLISFLRSLGVDEAVEDSSGNAGSSFAAYAARAGMRARVYVPSYASGPKRTQIAAYGAEVVPVPGPRSKAAEAVRQTAEKGAVYASHAHLPQGLPGMSTVAYELVDQMGDSPGTVIVPAGQGSLLLGMGRGFVALQRAGMISRLPLLVGVQAAACAPLWAASRRGSSGLESVSEGATLAEGVRILHPLRSEAILQMVSSTQGFFVTVDEDNIIPGRDELAQRGFYVEPTSAIVWNALSQVADRVPEPIVAILTGSGLKSSP
ncbi:MAG: pyridoxal-phosphate dependent enzyme [Chloroflexota bacterium]|nr:pyridoxal-phosphate dependent enzyme [Chloroflexota bacterium]